jgi:two-component sensor histidine kinase/HAMP domain-containing protein
LASTVRKRLGFLIAGLLAPLLVIVGASGYTSYRAERTTTEAMLLDTARALALGVDREVGKAEVLLRALSKSDALAAGDLARFHARASEALYSPEIWISLSGTDGETLLATRAPYGTRLPQARLASRIREVAASGKPWLSGVVVGAYTGRTVVLLMLPVIGRSDEVRYVLTMALSSDLFMKLVEELSAPSTWLVTIMDREGRFVARSRDQERFAGRQASSTFRSATAQVDTGAVESVSSDGVPIWASFARSSDDALTAVISYPLSEFDALRHRALSWMLAFAAVAAAGFLFALRAARAITRPLESLVRSARALGQGMEVASTPTGLREFDLLGAELSDAAATRSLAERRLLESQAHLRLALDVGGIGEWEYDPRNGRLLASPATRALFGYGIEHPFEGRSALRGLAQADRRELIGHARRVLATGGSFELTHPVTWPDSSTHWLRTRARSLREAEGVRLIGACQDVTAEWNARSQQSLLINELNHRVKNSLATVQSLAAMTFRAGGDMEAVRDSFMGRVLGMARTHDLLTRSEWEAASLQDLVKGELDPYQDVLGHRIRLRGPSIALTPQATLALGLAVHELATNAAKYGALSVPEGRVTIYWRSVRIEGTPNLLLEWTEIGGPPVQPPSREGFGSKLIKRGLAQDLGGDIKLNFAPSGLVCVITFPLTRIEFEHAPSPAPLAVRT